MTSLHIVFARSGVEYALGAALVQEIAWLPELSSVADASPWVIGAFNDHGCVVPVLDLALCFGRGCPPPRMSDSIIVVALDGERFAVVADELVDAAPIVAEDVESLDEHRELLGCAVPLVSGIAKRGERLAMMLDARALLAGAAGAMPGEDEVEGAWPKGAPPDTEREVFLARARALARPIESRNSAGEQFAVASLDAELIGLPVLAVREFMRLGSVWPVPCCPKHILGTMNVRGDIVTLVDLRPVLGLPAQGALTEVVVVRDGDLTIGLAVSEILDIVEVDGVVPLPLPNEDREASFCRGTARLGDRVFDVVDIEAMLASRLLHVADGRSPIRSADRVLATGG